MKVAGSESFDPKLSSATLDGLKVIDLAQIDPKLSSAALNCRKVIDFAQNCSSSGQCCLWRTLNNGFCGSNKVAVSDVV